MIAIEKLKFCGSIRILAFVFPIVLLLIVGGYFGLKSSNQGKGDPRISYSGPFENIHPSVSYVGDDACASCHQDYLDRFRHHPMGMALSTTTEATPIEGFGLASRNPFKVESLQYKVAIEKNRVYHEEGLPENRRKGLKFLMRWDRVPRRGAIWSIAMAFFFNRRSPGIRLTRFGICHPDMKPAICTLIGRFPLLVFSVTQILRTMWREP